MFKSQHDSKMKNEGIVKKIPKDFVRKVPIIFIKVYCK